MNAHQNASAAPASPYVHVEIEEPEVSLGTKEKIFITMVASQTHFFGQLSRFSGEAIDALGNELKDYYSSNKGRPLSKYYIGSFCAALSSEDNFWYRACIESVRAKKARVRFVDYGDTEEKPISTLCALEPQFCKLPKQGIMMALRSPSSELSDEDFSRLLLDGTFELNMEALTGDGIYEVSFTNHTDNKTVLPHFAS